MNINELPEASATKHESRGNLAVQLGTEASPQRSPRWQMGSISIEFLRLDPHRQVFLTEGTGVRLAKVITGSLEEPVRQAYCEPMGTQDTRLPSQQITAGDQGALLAMFSLPEDNSAGFSSMSMLSFSGPLAGELRWQRFSDQYGQVTNAFDGADAWIGPGFHLIDEAGDEITYLNLWTAGKGVDLTTHNHGHPPSSHNPAFAETHLVLSNGTGEGGMYTCSEPGDPVRERYVVPTGFEHGPFFEFDPVTGVPVCLDSGAVKYPWHGWQAGSDSRSEQVYDVVAAFETAVKYTRVPV